MFVDWKPSPHLSTLARQSGLPMPDSNAFNAAIGEFIAYWLTQTKARTQHEWDHALVKALKGNHLRSMNQKMASGRRLPKSENFAAIDYGEGGQAMNRLAQKLKWDGIHTEPQTRTNVCDKHGEYEAKSFIGQIWSKCPTCNAEVQTREKAEAEAKNREAKLQAWQKRIEGAGIPERFQNRSLKSFVAEHPGQKRALAFATSYADGFDDVLKTGHSAVFVGKPGTGKTHLSVGIGLRIMHRDNRTVLFTSVLRAIRRVKESWRRNSQESESDAITHFVQPDLLIFDEVGQQFGSDTEKLILFDILNERYEKRRPTLLLANVPLEDYRRKDDPPDLPLRPGVISYLGERLIDRLREDGGKIVPFDFESMRGRL
ncbi:MULTISPECIES: ATP-binding protein [Mycetohabitans]|nr:ATP-binding protein [Mycetohabitans sp. B5]